MISFFEQQEKIKEFIENNYKEQLDEYNIKMPLIVADFLDLDKYKGDFTLFIDFDKLEFPVTQYSDDCELIEKLSIKFFLVMRNDTHIKLKENLLNATFAFYKMYRNNPRFNISDNTTLLATNFFDYVEATKYIVASEIGMSMEVSI
jgi:hypothetical protein